nr:ATPase subunit 9, mitochondrial [Tanacetum cinerariifolium]
MAAVMVTVGGGAGCGWFIGCGEGGVRYSSEGKWPEMVAGGSGCCHGGAGCHDGDGRRCMTEGDVVNLADRDTRSHFGACRKISPEKLSGGGGGDDRRRLPELWERDAVYRLCSLCEASEYKIEKNALHGKKKREENYQLEMLEGAKLIGAGAATIASAGAAIGIGNVLSSSIHSVARNPSLAKQSFGYAILGFALTEAIASFALMMAFLISFVFRSKNQRKKVSVS